MDGQPIGKPGDFERARVQLRALAGQTVEFHSALAVTDGVRTEKADIVTRCPPLSDQAIDAYLRAEEPYDTAGSAKAESLGIALMESIQSDDPTAIIGLPLIALTSMLARFGLIRWPPPEPRHEGALHLIPVGLGEAAPELAAGRGPRPGGQAGYLYRRERQDRPRLPEAGRHRASAAGNHDPYAERQGRRRTDPVLAAKRPSRR